VNELIKVTYSEDAPTVSARELHEFLEIQERYSKWFDRMSEYGFALDMDYTPYQKVHPQNQQPITDHALTVPMAKEICMIQRSAKGRQARQYFLQLEEAWNSPEMIMSRALRMAEGKIKSLKIDNAHLTVDIAIMAPKAEYFDALVDRGAALSVRNTAKELGIKERKFVEMLIQCKYVFRDKKGKLMPYAQYTGDLFVLKESFNEKTQWGGTQMLITPKGRETFRLLTEGMSA
jgi:anti-repressor protein